MEYPTIQELKNAITDSIYTNNAGLVTAEIVQERMIDIIETLDAIGGVAVHNHQYLLADNITEFTSSHGVDVEGVVLKDNSIYMPAISGNSGVMFIDNIRFLHTYGVDNFFLGKNAGNFTLDSSYGGTNTGIGDGVLSNLTTGYRNFAIGYNALYSCTQGYLNLALGYMALYDLASGANNIAIGAYAGQHSNSQQTVYIGIHAGENNNGMDNIAIGIGTLMGPTASPLSTGYENVAIGSYSSMGATSARYNTTIGTSSFKSISSGNYNVGIGINSGRNATTGSFNIFIGASAGRYETGTRKLIIDSLDRSNEATGRSSAIIYGEISSTAANQILTLGGGGTVNINGTLKTDHIGELTASHGVNFNNKIAINSTSTDSMVRSLSTISQVSGVFGEALVTTDLGIGIGVDAESTGVNTGSNYGLYAGAKNGSYNYGIYIEADWPPAGDDNYAIYSASAAKSFFTGNIIADADVQNPDYTSGFGGSKWQISEAGNAEFNNVRIRGGLQVYEMIINRLHYQNGNLSIGPGAGKVRSIHSSTQGSEQMYFETPEGQAMVPFSAGAIVMIHSVDIDRSTAVKSIVREVSAIQADGRVDMTVTAGWAIGNDVGIFEVGDEACTIGHTSDTDLQNSIYLSAIDGGNPFMRIYAGVSSYAKWNLTDKTTIKLQLGNLASLASYDILPASPGYGLYCDNVYLKGTIEASAGEIGGFTIDATEGIYAGAAETRVQMKPGVGIWAGATAIGDAPFSVTNAGVLKAISGKVGNWNIDSDSIYVGTKYNTADSPYTTDGITINADGTIRSENFAIDSSGAVNIKTPQPHWMPKVASNNLRHSHDSEIAFDSTDYVQVKGITFPNGLKGVIRVKFDALTTDSATPYYCYAKVCINGVQLGLENTIIDEEYSTFVHDIDQDWESTDELELWIKSSKAEVYCYARNFRVYYDDGGTYDVIAVASSNSFPK